jgi:hypothetical protein
VDYANLEKIYIQKFIKVQNLLRDRPLFILHVFSQCLEHLRNKEAQRLKAFRAKKEQEKKKIFEETSKEKKLNLNMASKFPQSLQPQVPKFDESDLKRWLEDCKNLFLIYLDAQSGSGQLSAPLEDQIPKLLTSFVPEFARGVHDSNKDKSWNEYAEAMKTAFQSDNSMSAVRELMLSQTKRPGESLKAYLYRVSNLGERAETPLSTVDRCKVLTQLLPPSVAMAMLGWSKLLTVPQFIDRVETIFNKTKAMSANWGMDANPFRNAGDKSDTDTKTDKTTSDMTKICALLEKLSDTDKPESPLDQVAKKLDQMLDMKKTTTQTPNTDSLDEKVMKIFEAKYPHFAQGTRGRGRGHQGRGRGRGGRGYGRGGYGYGRGGFVQAYGGYAGGQAPNQYGYAPMVAYGQPPAPQAYQQPAIMPPPQQQRGGRGGSYGQQGVRLCYVCGDATHLSYSCPKRNFQVGQ